MSNINQRHVDIFDPAKFEHVSIVVVGAGTIGSWVTLGLAKMGIRNITVYDYDRVEEHNVGTQLFGVKHIGKYKTKALREIVSALTDVEIQTHEEAVETLPECTLAILAVDSLEARRQLLESSMLPVIDGRMGGQGYEVHFSGAGSGITVPTEASEDVCTAKGISYVSMGIAAEIVAMAKKFLSAETVPSVVYKDYSTQRSLLVK